MVNEGEHIMLYMHSSLINYLLSDQSVIGCVFLSF